MSLFFLYLSIPKIWLLFLLRVLWFFQKIGSILQKELNLPYLFNTNAASKCIHASPFIHSPAATSPAANWVSKYVVVAKSRQTGLHALFLFILPQWFISCPEKHIVLIITELRSSKGTPTALPELWQDWYSDLPPLWWDKALAVLATKYFWYHWSASTSILESFLNINLLSNWKSYVVVGHLCSKNDPMIYCFYFDLLIEGIDFKLCCHHLSSDLFFSNLSTHCFAT